MKRIIPFCAFVFMTTLTSPALQAGGLLHYVVEKVAARDLGTLGGAESAANDINDAGKIVGWALTGDGGAHAFLYSAGSFTNIAASIPGNSFATGINNSSSVVGYYLGNASHHAFHWLPEGVLITLNDVSPLNVTQHSEAYAICDTGLIAGSRSWGGSHREAIVWIDDVTFRRLSVTSQFLEYAFDVNDLSQVVGASGNTSPNPLRWQFDPAGSAATAIPWSCGAPYIDGEALGINAQGDTVGHARCLTANSHEHAFYWDGSSAPAHDLGVLPPFGQHSVATEVNEAVFISGYADRLVPDGQSLIFSDFAFIYHRDFGMYPLPKLPDSLSYMDCQANALNNLNGTRVQLVGFCDTARGRRAVRWDVSVRSVLPALVSP